MRKNLRVYEYNDVPDQLPASSHKARFADTLDANIESLWTPEIKVLMHPVGHPNSKRYFIQQYKAAQLIKTGAKAKGIFAIANADDWTLIAALLRVSARRGIAPRQLLKPPKQQAMPEEPSDIAAE